MPSPENIDSEDDLDALEFEDDDFEEAPEPVRLLGRVAVVGYPNVGKSTLVNRLSGTRTAIVHETAGDTRDRKEIEVDWNGEKLLMIDTGGVDDGDAATMAKEVTKQARAANAEADIVLFVVDGAAGMSAADSEIAEMLRRERVETIVTVNKIDNVPNEHLAMEFHSLGLGDPMPVSAHHGNNTGDLLDSLVERLRERGTAFDKVQDETVRIAVVGRPNVGKSTLVNAMLGNDRTIVSDVAGTTRDSIDSQFTYNGRDLVLVDTAGLRRGTARRQPLEYYSEVRALQAVDRADVALLLVDASDGLKDSDLSVADKVRERGCATIVVLSKWDINDVDLADIREKVERKLRQRPQVITSSGLTGRNITKLIEAAIELRDRSAQRVPTPAFNNFITQLKEERQPPLDKRSKRRLNLLYGTQYQTLPPRFRIHVNDRTLVTRDYGFWLENRLRAEFSLEGCAVMIDFRSRAR
jgi:GTP-binding protein